MGSQRVRQLSTQHACIVGFKDSLGAYSGRGSDQGLPQGQVRRCLCPAAWVTHRLSHCVGRGLAGGAAPMGSQCSGILSWSRQPTARPCGEGWNLLGQESQVIGMSGRRHTGISVPAREAHCVSELGSLCLRPAHSQGATPALALPPTCGAVHPWVCLPG